MPAVFFIIWLIICSWLAGNIFKRFFPVPSWINYILGGFSSIAILGLTANIFATWFKLTDPAILISFISAALILTAWFFIFRPAPEISIAEPVAPAAPRSLPPAIWLIFSTSLTFGFYAVSSAADAGGLSSPWQVLTPWLLLPVLICSAVIFIAVFHGDKTWKILGAVMMFSFLIHSYLFVYSAGFGGDRFRHLASESRIISGLQYQPTLLAQNLWLKQVGPIMIPAALLDEAKLSYGFQWSLEVIASKISGVGVFQVNRFLLPLLWSLVLPLLIYAISLLIRPDRRLALLAAALSNSFYLLQYYGSQGLPASYGFLVFALAAALWLAWLKARETKILFFCLFFSVLAYFNYSLAFILIVIFGTLAESCRLKKAALAVAGMIAAAALFLLDAGWPPRLSFEFDRLYAAWRDGNILFFQSGARLASSIGEAHLIIDLLILTAFLAAACWLIVKLWRDDDRQANPIAVFFSVLMAAYLASWLFVSNGHLLSRRLTLFAVFPLIFISAYGINVCAARTPKKIAKLSLVALLSLFTAYSYFSGPVLDVSVTKSDLIRAQELWPAAKDDPDACVREPLPIILALEYVSAKEFQETINNQNCK